MHPQDFRSIADHLYDAYCTLHEEIHRLRKENKALGDELNKIKSLNTTLSAKLCNLGSARVLKMGAEWFFDGDFLLNLSLIRRVKFTSPICNVKISKEGRIAFTCNNKIFVLRDKKIFLVEETIRPFEIRAMRHDLIDLERRVFDFYNEDLVILHRGNVAKFKGDEKEWSIEMNNAIYMCVDQGMIYIGTDERAIHVHGGDGNPVNTMEMHIEFTSFIVRGGEILLVSDECLTLLPGSVHIDNHKILATEFDGKTIYHGSNSGTVSMALPSGNVLQPYDTINYKSAILSLMKYGNYLFVATEEHVVDVVDLETKRSMRIVLPDNVVNMCCNRNEICFVDNNGGLRIWEIKK